MFWEPVDPIALGIPTYHEVIPKKDARDLRTIRENLDADKYESVDAWEAEMDLMVNNAIKFNSLESEVGQAAVKLQTRVRESLSTLRVSGGSTQQGKKRSAPGDPSKASSSSVNGGHGASPVPSSSKKAKLD